MSREKNSKEIETARMMIGRHLRRHAAASTTATSSMGAHLDDDAAAAFIEGRLGDREAAPMISHLVDCSACRRMTVELTRFAIEAEPAIETPASDLPPQTGRLRRLLEDLAARVLPASNDDAVFAYQAQPSEPESLEKTNTGDEGERYSDKEKVDDKK